MKFSNHTEENCLPLLQIAPLLQRLVGTRLLLEEEPQKREHIVVKKDY